MTEEKSKPHVSKYPVDPELEKRRFPAGREDETGDPLAQLAQDYKDGDAEIKKAKEFPSGGKVYESKASFDARKWYNFQVTEELCRKLAMRLEDGNPNGGNAKFRKEIADVINGNSRENQSNTPDFILAQFMETCLKAFETASNAREKWYGKHLSINGDGKTTEERIIDKLKEFDAINKVRHFTEVEGKEYSELMQQWATLVNEGKITTGKKTALFTFLDYDSKTQKALFDLSGTDLALDKPRKWLTKAEVAMFIADGFLIQFEDGEILTPKEIGNIFEEAAKPQSVKIPEMGKVNTRSPEGYLFNAAMAILTTEYMPEMEFGAMFKKVAALAVKIVEGDEQHDADNEPKAARFENAGNKNYEKR